MSIRKVRNYNNHAGCVGERYSILNSVGVPNSS